MNKTTANIILVFIDISALFACYHVYSEYRDVTNQVYNLVEFVMIQKPLGFYVTLIIVPTLHAAAFINIPDNWAKLVSISFIFFSMLLLILTFAFDLWFELTIIDSGYVYCEAMSETMRISEFRVYLKEGLECTSQN